MKKEDKLKKFSEHEKSQPEQLSLFTLLAPVRENYSHTLNVYDEIPRASYGKPALINNQFLLSLEREFEVGDRKYKVEIKPARIKNSKGEERDFYIGKREDVIEDALRKLAADGRRAESVLLDGNFAVIFTRKALFDELSAAGHKYSYEQIEEALEILLSTTIKLTEQGSDEAHSFHPIESYGIKGKDGEDVTYVKFSPFVTTSIKNNSFRLINYKKLLGYKSIIAYRLHKKLTHHFTYADSEKTYHFSLNKTFQNFGLSLNSPLSVRLREMKKSLGELDEAKIIKSYEVYKVIGKRRKNATEDYTIEITPHQEFLDEVLLANKDFKRRVADARLIEVMPDFYRDKIMKKG